VNPEQRVYLMETIKMKLVNIKNKEKRMILITSSLFLLSIFILSDFSLAEEQSEDTFVESTLTIGDFFRNMKLNPQSYYLIINRSQEELDYLVTNSSLREFLDYFNVGVSNSFKDDGKNFVLIEIPSTYLGDTFGLAKHYSYIEVYQDSFLDYQPYEYYLVNNWSTFNYSVIYSYPQTLYSNFSGDNEREESQARISQVDTNHDGFLTEGELTIAYLNTILSYVLSEENINNDYIVLDHRNEITPLPFGEREFCLMFNHSNNIFDYYLYSIPNLGMSESCFNRTTVNELVCAGGIVSYEQIGCPNDYSCFDGACYPIKEDTNLTSILISWILGSSNTRLSEILLRIISLFG